MKKTKLYQIITLAVAISLSGISVCTAQAQKKQKKTTKLKSTKPPGMNINFHDFYQANKGEKQIAARKYSEAYAIYSKLASSADDPKLAVLGKARAAVALGLQKNKYEQGLVQARGVSERPYAVQACIQLMFAKKDFKKLLEEFNDEDIAAWPERKLPSLPKVGREDLRALALYDRGRAFLRTGDTKAAARDIEKALEFAVRFRQLEILSLLSKEIYKQKLKDADKVFETNMRIVELNITGKAVALRAGLSAAGYLRERKRYDEALKVLNRFPWRTMSGIWFVSYANATGGTLSDAGRFAEAGDTYRLLAEAYKKGTDIDARGAASMQWGRMLVAAGNPEAAKKVYTELVKRTDIPARFRQQAKAALKELPKSSRDSKKNEK